MKLIYAFNLFSEIEADNFIGQDIGNSGVRTLSDDIFTPTQQQLLKLTSESYLCNQTLKLQQNIESNTNLKVFGPDSLQLPYFETPSCTARISENTVPTFSQQFLPTNNFVTRPIPVYGSQQNTLTKTYNENVSLCNSPVNQVPSSQITNPEFYERTSSVQTYNPENSVTDSSNEIDLNTNQASSFFLAPLSVVTNKDNTAVQSEAFNEANKINTTTNLLNIECIHSENTVGNVSATSVKQLPVLSYNRSSTDIKSSVLTTTTPPPPPNYSSNAKIG